MPATVKLLVTIPHPSTELRLQGIELVVLDEGLAADENEGDGEWIDITQTDWYRTRAAQITAGRCLPGKRRGQAPRLPLPEPDVIALGAI